MTARLATGASFVVLSIAALTVAAWLVQPRSGLFGLANLLGAHLVLACLLAVPLAVVARSRSLASALVVVLVLAGARYGDDWYAVPVDATDPDLRVATWNLEYGTVDADATVPGLAGLHSDVVALQELRPEHVAAIEADSELRRAYPYRALAPAPGVSGIGLLSRYPLDGVTTHGDPVSMRAVVRSAEGRIVVHTAHPYPSVIQTITPLRIPVGYDPTERDAVIERVRERVAADLDADVPVVLLGDFNVAPTEPGFDVLTRGLVDAHRAVGNGPGWTWRPSRLEGLGIGVLRIDYVLTSGFQPLSIETDCRNAGDHCIVTAGLDLADR